MNENVLLMTIVFLCCLLVFLLFYKKCESNTEKILYVLVVATVFLPTIIYYLDKLNVPTRLGWNENVDAQNWLSFISTYCASIISAIIGAVVLVWVTIMQIKKANLDSLTRDKEERRINNLPLLKYDFNVDYGCLNLVDIELTFDNEKELFSKYIILSIKNIGINAVKKCYINVENEYLKQSCTFPLDYQGCIDKDEQKSLTFVFKFKEIESTFKFNVYYQDLLSNWYKQEVILNYICNSDDLIAAEFKVKVNDEMLLVKEPVFDIKL